MWSTYVQYMVYIYDVLFKNALCIFEYFFSATVHSRHTVVWYYLHTLVKCFARNVATRIILGEQNFITTQSLIVKHCYWLGSWNKKNKTITHIYIVSFQKFTKCWSKI